MCKWCRWCLCVSVGDVCSIYGYESQESCWVHRQVTSYSHALFEHLVSSHLCQGDPVSWWVTGGSVRESSGSQSAVPRPAAWESPGNFGKRKFLGLASDPKISLGLGPSMPSLALQVILMQRQNWELLRYTGRSLSLSPGSALVGSVTLGKLLMAQGLGFLFWWVRVVAPLSQL